jgi:hypothetical protein
MEGRREIAREKAMRRKYFGQCHCGKVTYEVEADLERGQNAICNCTSCTMKGFIHHHVEKARFRLLTGFDDLKLYKFGTLSAEHYFCKTCGVESFYRSRSDPNMWDVNVRCLRNARTGDRVDIYALKYQLGDGANWEKWQAARHAQAEGKARTGTRHPPKLWRLVAPAESVDPHLDVGEEFLKSWGDGTGRVSRKTGQTRSKPESRKRSRRKGP